MKTERPNHAGNRTGFFARSRFPSQPIFSLSTTEALFNAMLFWLCKLKPTEKRKRKMNQRFLRLASGKLVVFASPGQLCWIEAKRDSMKSTSGCVRILALSCTLGVLLALYFPSSVLGQTTSAVDYYKRGVAKQFKDDYDGAIADSTRAIKLDPKYVPAYYLRGVAKQEKGDSDGATADFNRAIELDPKFASAYNNRGLARQGKGNSDGAIADFNRAIELDPKYAYAYYNRGNAKKAKGDLDGARADYKRAIQLDPNMKEAQDALK
jgi:tetratricopeptide (TPR) repeat protein